MKINAVRESRVQVVVLRSPDGKQQVNALELTHFIQDSATTTKPLAPIHLLVQDARTLMELLALAIAEAEGRPHTPPAAQH